MLTVGVVGLAFISNTLAVLASELQPLDTQVAVMEYVPIVEISILVPVALFDHKTVPVAHDAVKIMLFGAQTIA